jgi:2,3-bisphosphoglycerate-independent phosphoglycerate mutase
VSSKVALLILDGFGITPEIKGNAILSAKTPNFDMIIDRFPKCLLKASAEEVGLPWGEFGSSEVGHTTIGLGRIILQDLPQITKMFSDGSFRNKPEYKKIIKQIDMGGKVNLLFLISDGAVHGHIRHLIFLVKLLKQDRPRAEIVLHAITDGRDTGEKSCRLYFDLVKNEIGRLVRYGSIMGRYFAMDRDKNWDRIEAAYKAITGQAQTKDNPGEVIDESYNAGKTDEFVEPCSFKTTGIDIKKDIFIFTNYRSDRALQITRSFIDPNFSEFNTLGAFNNFYAMTTYDDNLKMNVLLSNLDLNNPSKNSLANPLSQLISENSLKQFHIAETEKFAHITYFFSGGVKQKYAGESDLLIQSNKVKSHDMKPEMKAADIALGLMKAANQGFDFIAANFANGDMVGHSGNLSATIKAIEIMDRAVGKVTGILIQKGYEVFICADHGNCDEMIDFQSGKPNKEHTLNPVPFIHCNIKRAGKYSSKESFFNSDPVGILADVTPTMLDSLSMENQLK